MKEATPDQSPQTGSDEPGVLLFFPFRQLPESPEELFERLTDVSGIHAGDLRYKLVGIGLKRFTPQMPLPQQQNTAAEMNDLGIPAAVISEKTVKRRLSLPVARRVEITDDAVVFFNRQDERVFTVDDSVDLLLVVADLSGKAVEKSFIAPGIEQQPPVRTFDTALMKISTARAAAVICSVGGQSPAGVLIDHDTFSYRSMGDFMDLSASVNFRNLVNATIDRSKSAVTDHHFGAANLAGAKPDFSGSKRDVLAALGRYTRFLIAGAEAGLLTPEGETAADAGYAEAAGKDSADTAAGFDQQTASDLPEPPPALDRSGILARFSTAPQELLQVGLFGLAPFLSVFMHAGDFENPLLWKTVFGILMLGAGLLLFPYALVVLYYKRMVENTPTSKVRSMAMGTVELEGRARQYYDLKTAHSKTRCIYYRCRYYRRKQSREGQQWELMRAVNSGRLPFYLEDDTGRVLIRPKRALFHISRTRQEFSGNQSLWLSAGIGDENTKIYEDLIAESASIYVLGNARPERVARPTKDKVIDKLRALKSNPAELMRYDQNGDGRVDMTEWETARQDVENVVRAESLMDGGPTEQVVIKKAAYGTLPFIIADTEDGIVRTLTYRIWIFLLGGLLLIGLGTELLVRLYG